MTVCLSKAAVRNGILTAGDKCAKGDLKTISPRRDRQSETTAREKWAAKAALLLADLEALVSNHLTTDTGAPRAFWNVCQSFTFRNPHSAKARWPKSAEDLLYIP